MIHEFHLIKLIRSWIPKERAGPFGLGDDTAVLSVTGKGDWLLTTDTLVEGVDFVKRKTSPECVGRKALAVNLSDIAAMGGKPVACVVSLGLPRSLSKQWVDRFYRGLIRIARTYDTLCVGGDISRARELFISVALLGRAQTDNIVTRRGARPGDWIGVTGRLGGSILGHHLCFQPRVEEARFLAKKFKPNAMIDISDGMLQDLGHILDESKVGASLDVGEIPVSPEAKKIAKGNYRKALEHALTDGEDFELLFTLAKDKKASLDHVWRKYFPHVELSWIGRIQKGKAFVRWRQGNRPISSVHFKKKGFSHF
ncbi:MAG: thiamine-phosphate kinase [Candidatus Omnitrophica bacterium]|nr:thiamine-phosphate kinase [Candidatus Omnitrophota bacterium]MDD5671415.1 thiamine-phosphate kinase [Candidatus Omnitrophota bacterium]